VSLPDRLQVDVLLAGEALRDLGEDDIHETALQLRNQVNITYEEAVGRRWKPKTPKSAREVPFDFDVRVELTLRSSPTATAAGKRASRRSTAVSIGSRRSPHSTGECIRTH